MLRGGAPKLWVSVVRSVALPTSAKKKSPEADRCARPEPLIALNGW